LESAAWHGFPLVKHDQTKQLIGVLLLQATWCPWMKSSGRPLSSNFAILKPLFEMDEEQRTRVHVEKVAKILNRHPATIYRWIEAHENSQRVSVHLRRVGWNTGVVTNTDDPFDSPEQVVIWKAVNCVNRLAPWPIVTKLFGTPMSQFRESVRPVANIVERSVALNAAIDSLRRYSRSIDCGILSQIQKVPFPG
jgi:hypothetical protein